MDTGALSAQGTGSRKKSSNNSFAWRSQLNTNLLQVLSRLCISIRHVGILRWYELDQTDWVRILLLRRNSDAYGSIEVELTLPEQLSERISHSAKKIKSDGDSDQSVINELISAVIHHMMYLHLPNQAGFKLDVIEEDFLWTATLEITKEPDEQLFDILIPP